MKILFCAHCGVVVYPTEIVEGQRCENCDNVIFGVDNHIAGEFDSNEGNKLLLAALGLN